MVSRITIIAFFAVLATSCYGGVIPAVAPAALTYGIAPYASSYTASVVNHAIAAPVATPLVAAPAAPYFAAPAAPFSVPAQYAYFG